jgi:MSHA biogenesis protein MshQ
MHYNSQKLTYLRILPILLVCLSGNVYAAIGDYCETTFVDGATAHGNGKIEIGNSPTIYNNPDGVLAALNETNIEDLNCNGFGACQVSGTATETLNLGAFLESSNENNNVDVDSSSVTVGGTSGPYIGNNFGTINVNNGGILTFSSEHTQYRIKEINVLENGNNATLNLTPGDYYIEEIETYENTIINIIGSGDVRIFLRDHSDFEGNTRVNINGNVGQLLIYAYDKIHFKGSTEINGLVYSQDEVEFKDTTVLNGAASAGDKLKIKNNANIYYSCGASEPAPNQCDAVFPDGASTHSLGGTISFGNNSLLFGSDNNQLATTAVSKNGGSNVDTCDTADCVATGTPSSTISTVNFQTTASTIDVTVGFQDTKTIGTGTGDLSGYEYKNINGSSEATITFSDAHNEYWVDTLALGFKNTLYLQAGGTYWINQLTMGSQVDIIVQGSGTALIYVNQSLTFPSPGLINSPSNNSGDASKLVMYVFSDVTFNNQSTYTGSLYVEGDLSLISSSHAFGSISAANIDLGSQSTITYQSEEIADTDFGSLCTEVVIAPYQITGHPKSITDGDDWSWNGSYIVDWRAAMEDANNFGEGGVVSKVIESVDLSSLNASSLSTVDAFVSTWWSSSQSSSYHSMLRDFFLAGGDLILLQDDNSHDGIGEFLGIEAISGMSNPTTISSPLQDGPFGAVGSITLNDGASHLDSAQINALGGTICGVDQSEQTTFACWEEGEYALGAGKLVIITDTEFVTTISNEANYSSLNDKGKLALNVLEFLVRTPQTPTPLIEYHFDELSWTGSANEVIDSSGNNYNGTAIGGITTATGKICNAAQIPNNNSASTFEAVDTGVDLDTVIGSSGTISLWYKGDSGWNSGTDKRLFDATDGDKYFFAEIGADGRVKFRFEDGNDGDYQRTTDNAFSVGAGVWKHLTFVWDVSNITAKIFVDGVEQSVSSGSNADGGTTAFSGYDTLYFGDNRDASYFTGESSADGLIDEALVFDSVLTKTQIQTIFTNQDAGNNWDGTTRSCPVIACGTLNSVGIKIGSGGGSSDSQINTTSEALAIYAAWLNASSPATGSIYTGSDTYNVTASGSSEVDRIDFGGLSNYFAGTLPYPGADAGVSGDDLLVHTSGTLSLPAGDYTIFVQSDDGFSFIMDTLSGDTVSFSRFGKSDNEGGNELRFEGTTGNTSTGGSFNLAQDSVFNIAAIFFERTGVNYLEISIANTALVSKDPVDPADYEILKHGAIAGKVKFGQCVTNAQIDHYRIEHDAQGFTCEAENLTIKACADANCDKLYDEETSITLSPSGWSDGDTLIFTGEFPTSIRVQDEGSIILAKTGATPEADLRCFNGSNETCSIAFSDDGFELYGENTGDTLPDQLAANNFQNVNLRAVRSNNNVCEALLQGTQNIGLTYNCDSPDRCLTSLSGISVTGDGTGGNTGNIEVEFNDQGEASLAVLNYPDAGRLILSVQAEVDGVTIDSSDNEAVDVYPSYLQLTVDQSELLYGSSGTQNNYIAGEPFTVSIGAYGVNDALLPNYQAESPQLKVTRIQPASIGSNGHFKYSDTGTIPAQLTADFTSATGLSFSAGEHQYSTAYYDEVGRINIDVKDNSYLGNEILSNDSKTLGDFYPAYFGVALSATPSLADTCGIFSYIGEIITFATDPELTITAYNALNVITENYSDNYWNYLPNESTLEANLSFMDTSTYNLTGTAIVIDLGDAPLITNNNDYNGSGTVTITNGRFRYNKVDPADNRAFSPVSPFDAEISLAFSSHFFSSAFVDQNGNLDTICYQASYSDNTCLEWEIEEITGTQMRYGRLTLESTYGPEAEPLNVPIKAEYFNNNQWLLNTDDSNCTSIALTETAGQIILIAIDGYDLDLVGDVKSDGVLISGVPVGDQFRLKAPDPSQLGPGTQGQLALSLDPTAIGIEWPNHLNYDWDGDGFIDIDDFSKATITFGLFRGSDRIIQWREVSN